MAELIDLAALAAVPLARDPFEHIVVPRLIAADALSDLVRQFPDLPAAGLIPAATVRLPAGLARLAEEIAGPELGARFGLDLRRFPTMVTLRSRCRAEDGRIHTDSDSKIVSALLYLNPNWKEPAGRLRLLRSGTDIEDHAVEVAPEAGTFVAFRRSGRSWHGHTRFVGERRYIMINWMRDARAVRFETARHTLTAVAKGAFR
ncbi:MAG TPA: 2OG-Fe(II) oxygenase [Stellaceae bacterium]|nr:2OG-Fe(II) oxygenase [Stellaceae bacterium]